MAKYPPLRRPSRRFARYAARKGRAALTDASAAGVPSHEEHVCSSVLKENRSATAEPSGGMGGASSGAVRVDKFPRNSENESRDITREPLVMASEVGGLDPLHGYLKHGNLVLRMRFPYLELKANAEKFIERKTTTAAVTPVAKPAPKLVAKPASVPVAATAEAVQVAAAKKPPKAAKEQQQELVKVNEQTPYFE